MFNKKHSFFFAALGAVAVIASCSKTIESAEPDNQKDVDVPVAFGAYLNKTVATKAGLEGGLTTTRLQLSEAEGGGFGVFGYYTNDDPYSPSAKPDFMYNQGVFYNGSAWDYAPTKYWPNSYGDDAASEAIDRVSFFAYAPYVAVDYSTGLVSGSADQKGITALSRNSATGDPTVKYTVSMNPANAVDLCWGVAATNFRSSADGDNNTVAAGEPFINLVKPKVNDKLSFNFKHALSSVTFYIDTDVDVVGHGYKEGSDLIKDETNNETRIYVRAVTFEGFSEKGSLNLNSKASSPIWRNLAGGNRPDLTPITVYDGRKDGKEGVKNAVAVNEEQGIINPLIVQNEPYYDEDGNRNSALTPGVTHDSNVSLFSGIYEDSNGNPILDENGKTIPLPLYVIPNGLSMKITIVYDVETMDEHLAKTLSDGKTLGSTIENVITKTVTLVGGDELVLQAGKQYKICLHLGMTSVKMDAEVSAWDDNPISGEAHLPENVSSDASFSMGEVDLGEVPGGSSTGI